MMQAQAPTMEFPTGITNHAAGLGGNVSSSIAKALPMGFELQKGYRGYVRTIWDLMRYTYGWGQWTPFGSIQKAAGPVSTTTTGVWQAILGSNVWVQLNLEANSF